MEGYYSYFLFMSWKKVIPYRSKYYFKANLNPSPNHDQDSDLRIWFKFKAHFA